MRALCHAARQRPSDLSSRVIKMDPMSTCAMLQQLERAEAVVGTVAARAFYREFYGCFDASEGSVATMFIEKEEMLNQFASKAVLRSVLGVTI